MKTVISPCLRLFSLALALASWIAWATADENHGNARGSLSWSPRAGVEMQSPVGKVSLDGDAKGSGPVLRFQGKGGDVRLSSPKVEQPNQRELLLRYQVTGPGENGISIVRRITMVQRQNEAELAEEFSLTPAKVIDTDLRLSGPSRCLPPPARRTLSCRSTTAGRGPSRWAAKRCAVSGSWAT